MGITNLLKRKMRHELKHSKKEIQKGWSLVLSDGCYDKIPGLVLNLMGVATHLGITKEGMFKPKDRVMYDLSFPGGISDNRNRKWHTY